MDILARALLDILNDELGAEGANFEQRLSLAVRLLKVKNHL